jgi:hypothetical protein
MLYKLFFLPPSYYEWYMVPELAVLAILAAAGAHLLWATAPRTAVVLGATLVAGFALHLPYTMVFEHRIQSNIEDVVRVPLAHWLQTHLPPGDRVVSESVGYVGYYSRVKLYGYPGSRRPVRTTRSRSSAPRATRWRS